MNEDAKAKMMYMHHGNFPDSKVHGAKMGPIWGRQDPGGPDVGPMNFVMWVASVGEISTNKQNFPDI